MVKNTEPLQTEEPRKAEAKVEPKVDDLIAELERAGVTNAEDLSGKLRAGSEAGRLAQLLGDERKRSELLQQKLENTGAKPPPQQDFMDYPEGQTIDIETAIAKGVNKVLDKREAKAREVQQRSIEAWNRIQTDEDYHLIKDVWEEKLKDPGFVFKVQSGQIDPVSEYQSTLRGFYKTLLKKSHETITTMKGGDLKPPHVETGGPTPTNIVSETEAEPAGIKRLKEIKEKVDSGHVMSQEEELSVIDSIFDSPISPDVPGGLPPKR